MVFLQALSSQHLAAAQAVVVGVVAMAAGGKKKNTPSNMQLQYRLILKDTPRFVLSFSNTGTE